MKRFLPLLFLLALLCTPVFAQSATVEANPVSMVTVEPVGSTTVEDGGVVINVEAPNATNETPPSPPSDSTPLAWIAIGLTSLSSILVAISFALQIAGNRAGAVSNDPSAVALLERGYDTLLPDLIKAAIGPVRESLERSDQALQDMISLVRKITDGVAESSKPAKPAPYPPTAGTPLGTDYTSTTVPTSSTSITNLGGMAGAQGYDSGAFPGREPNRDA